MRLEQELAQSLPEQDSVLTVGVFDGVHRGHRKLIARLMREASDTGRLAIVVTFRNRPRGVVDSAFQPLYLTGLDERLRLLEQQGVDLVVPITFDSDLMKLSPVEFIKQLQRHLHMRGLVVGPDFALGHNREGDIGSLSTLGQDMGFTMSTIDALMDGGRPIKSTAIRSAIIEGDVTTAASFLGRTYALDGTVVRGAGRGSILGFPTANLEVPPVMAIPGNGIYATWAVLGGKRHMAATSVGVRPTFDEGERTIEAFILDYDGELYDSQVRLEFVQRLRDEMKYESVEALTEQIEKDVEQTRSVLKASAA